MQFEKVHTVREYWDGVRTGTANAMGSPHYFACAFDEDADDYAKFFLLYPVSTDFMERELRHWAIFRAWEDKFHCGLETEETHPGHGGLDAEYDQLGRWLDDQIKSLEPLPAKYAARFRATLGQDDRPAGVLRELEVAWTPTSA
jgi:hypothetical protein